MKKVLRTSLSRLRYLTPAQVIHHYGATTTAIFSRPDFAVPVVIPSRNEEHDIGSCLAALARSKLPVRPIVVVNCTTDKTYERAEAMGAIVVEKNGIKKMGATQKGIETALERIDWPDPSRKIILFTDADTLVPKNWSKILTKRLAKALNEAPEHGAAIFGTSLYLHGPSRMADIAQCLHGFYVDLLQWIRRGVPLIRGHTYGVALDSKNVIVDTINSLDPLQMYRDDVTIHDNLRKKGVRILRCLHPRAIVLTRGDRAHSFTEFLKNLYQEGYEKSTYDRQYDIANCPPETKP